MILARYLWLALFCTSVNPVGAEIFRVPAEYPTIQSALDVLARDDTVLVTQGVYAEALEAPEFGFALIGDVQSDTGLFERPVIDPSTLANPESLTCLKNTNGDVIIERVWFRNQAPMYPHVYEIGGGIHNGSAHLHLTECVFDSTFRGVYSLGGNVTAERCIFIRSVGHCLRLSGWPVIANECVFECIVTDWAAVIGGSNSVIENCRWQGDMGLFEWWLSLSGSNWRLANNIFGPGGGSNNPLLNLRGRDAIVENNLFFECISRNVIIALNGECDDSLIVRRNRFVGTRLDMQGDAGFSCAQIGGAIDSLSQPCGSAIFVDNIFERTRGGEGASAVLVLSSEDMIHCEFRDMPESEQCAVRVIGEDVTLRESIFSNTEFAALSENLHVVDARRNWWGHASGPYHPTLNPQGQGDEVGDAVNFVPWYTDTLFFTGLPEPRPPLPESASLMAYPNPFNQATTLQLTVPRAGIARVELFDITGRRVQELWSGPLVDRQEIVWNANDFASGLYFVRAWDPLENRPLAMTKVVLLK